MTNMSDFDACLQFKKTEEELEKVVEEKTAQIADTTTGAAAADAGR